MGGARGAVARTERRPARPGEKPRRLPHQRPTNHRGPLADDGRPRGGLLRVRLAQREVLSADVVLPGGGSAEWCGERTYGRSSDPAARG